MFKNNKNVGIAGNGSRAVHRDGGIDESADCVSGRFNSLYRTRCAAEQIRRTFMDKLQILHRDVKMLKAAKRIYAAGRICTVAAFLLAGIMICTDLVRYLDVH